MSLVSESNNKSDDHKNWTIKAASDRFSRLFRDALKHPQFVVNNRRAHEKVVVLSQETFEALKERAGQGEDFIDVMRQTPVRDMRLPSFRRYPKSRMASLDN